MTVKSYRTFSPLQQQRTQATLYNEGLARVRDEQAGALIPRSAASWGAEQERLGSWRSGQGMLRPSGVGEMYQVGQGTYNPIGMSGYTEVGRSSAVVEQQRNVLLASQVEEERARWRR